MQRIQMIKTVGEEFHTSNIENGEFSYQQLSRQKLNGHFKLDIRFFDKQEKVAVLIETKKKYSEKDHQQLFDYLKLETKLCKTKKIVAILANTENDDIKVWKILDDDVTELEDTKLKTYGEYVRYFKKYNVNDKNLVLSNTSQLNGMLHDNGIPEKIRSQFVGTCLLAIKYGLIYKGLSTSQINQGIKDVLSTLLKDDLERAKKLVIIQSNVLESQAVCSLDNEHYEELLEFIKTRILPYINDESHEGQDILSYFFTTFNKYVAREDKNQAFTPNHIAHFMAKVAGIYKNSKVLDPTCGSGTFLVQAMAMELQQCETDKERDDVTKHQIYGVEFDENVFGLSTTNMLIHGDGNTNIRLGSCFDESIIQIIKDAKIDVVLMNPPYNASKNQVPEEHAKKYGKSSTDPSKGLVFVHHIAECVGKGRLVTLLPMACAISDNKEIQSIKKNMLEKHTLDAVFSFPAEMFYPGASVVACCMVFNLGHPHPKDYETFFGYFKDDGFTKRKGIGRVDVNNLWDGIEKEWLYLYTHRQTTVGKSISAIVSEKDEWCAEAYMETDYRNLNEEDFARKVREYVGFKFINEY